MGGIKEVAQKRWKQRQCLAKKNYATESIANKDMERMLVSIPAWQTHRLNVYKCPHCHTFHIGNKPK